MKTFFALDTTSHYGSIALSTEEKILLEYNFAMEDELSETLIISIDRVLASMNPPLNFSDIDVYSITIGPGLFTGLRVGLATFKGILLDTKKPVVPVISLEAVAYKLRNRGIPVVSMIDARRNELYIAIYSSDGEDLREISSPELIPVEKLEEHVSGILKPGEAAVFTGSGASVYHEQLKESFPKCQIDIRSFFLAPEVNLIAAREYKKKAYITDLQKLLPLYIRKPDAEQNYERAEGKS